MKVTAVTAFAIVGLFYILQKHGTEIEQKIEIIESYKKHQTLLESNLTTQIQKEGILESKNSQLLSDFQKANIKYKTEIKNLNEFLVEKDKYLKDENEKANRLINDAKEVTEKIRLEYQEKSNEVKQLLSEKSSLEENLTNQIQKKNSLIEEKSKIENRMAKLLTVDKVKTFDSLLSKQESLEDNLTNEIAKEHELENKNLDLKNRINKMLQIAEEATEKAIIEHDKDMQEYQNLLSKYQNLENNLSLEIEKENTIIEQKSELELELKEEIEKEKELESKLILEVAKEESLKEQLSQEIEKENALKVELNSSINNEKSLVKDNEKLKFEMSELLFISNDSREKAKIAHQQEIDELKKKLAEEIEKEQKLESNLTAEIEQENLLKENNAKLEVKLVEQISEAKNDKETALSEYKAKIKELEATVIEEVDKEHNLESNLTSELEKKKLLLEEKSILEEKIKQQNKLFDEESQKLKMANDKEISRLEENLSIEIAKWKALDSNLSVELEKQKVLLKEKVELESIIAQLHLNIDDKDREIAEKEKLYSNAKSNIEELTRQRDELDKLSKERAIEIGKAEEATKMALLEVEKVKADKQNLLDDIAEKKRAEEKRVLEEEKIAKEKLLEAFNLTRVEFETNSMKLTKKSEELLNVTAEVMKKYPNFHYNIQGHTDNRGKEEFNVKLSGKRAKEVKKYLISRGLQEDVLSTEGIGSAQPIADNETKEGRILDRRVVFQIIKP